MNNTNIAWEKRSKIYGAKIEGVLPKSFPRIVNGHLDKWMYKQIKSQIPSTKSQILDLGCGYGRLSEHILNDFPKATTFGIDVARHYVNLYNKVLSPRGKAVVGDVRRLPFKDNFFDTVFMVTTLMYVIKKDEQKRVMSEIFRVLKSQGTFVIIERNPTGQLIVTVGGLVSKLRGEGKREINAVSFSKQELVDLISSAGGTVDSVRGLPFFTLSLPFSMVLNLISKSLCGIFLQLIGELDKIFSWLLTPSLYISYSGVKKSH